MALRKVCTRDDLAQLADGKRAVVHLQTLLDGSPVFKVTLREDELNADVVTFEATTEEDAWAIVHKLRELVDEHCV